MDVGQHTPDQIRWMVIIHLVFVSSGVLLAAMDWTENHAKSPEYRRIPSCLPKAPIPSGWARRRLRPMSGWQGAVGHRHPDGRLR